MDARPGVSIHLKALLALTFQRHTATTVYYRRPFGVPYTLRVYYFLSSPAPDSYTKVGGQTALPELMALHGSPAAAGPGGIVEDWSLAPALAPPAAVDCYTNSLTMSDVILHLTQKVSRRPQLLLTYRRSFDSSACVRCGLIAEELTFAAFDVMPLNFSLVSVALCLTQLFPRKTGFPWEARDHFRSVVEDSSI